MRKLPAFGIKINKSEFPAPCGCIVRFDNDGLVRLHWCKLHESAERVKQERDELLAILTALRVTVGRCFDDIGEFGSIRPPNGFNYRKQNEAARAAIAKAGCYAKATQSEEGNKQ